MTDQKIFDYLVQNLSMSISQAEPFAKDLKRRNIITVKLYLTRPGDDAKVLVCSDSFDRNWAP